MRRIQYAIHLDEGTVISRVDDELAWPVLDFAAIGRGGMDKCPLTGVETPSADGPYLEGNFHGPTRYNLEPVKCHEVGREWSRLKWTRKIHTKIKNHHRRFWGFKPLPERDEKQLFLLEVPP